MPQKHLGIRSIAMMVVLVALCAQGAFGDTISTPLMQYGYGALTSNVAYSPDGTKFLTASLDGKARLFDVNSGVLIRTFTDRLGNPATVNSVAFSPDGTKVVTGGGTLWDAKTGDYICTFTGHTGYVNSVAFSPDGSRILTGAEDQTAKLWNAGTGMVIRTFSGHLGAVTSVAFSPDGTKVLTGSDDYTAKLWDAEAGVVIRTFSHTSQVLSVAFSPDGTKVLTGSNDYTAKLRNAATGSLILTLTGHTAGVNSVAFSLDGTRVLTGSADHTARLRDTTTGALICTFTGHTGYVNSVAFSPDGTRVLTGSGGSGGDNTAKQWDVATGAVIRTFTGYTTGVYSVAFSPDGIRALTGMTLWSTTPGMEIRTFIGHTGRVNSTNFSPDGTKILSGSNDQTAKIWDAETGSAIRTFTGNMGAVTSVAVSPDGANVLTGSGWSELIDNTWVYHGEAKLFDMATGALIRTFTGHTGYVNSVAFSPDGTKVLTGADDQTAKLWDATTGAVIRPFIEHTAEVYSVAFSPDGTKVLTGSGDTTAKLWATTGAAVLIRTFTGHTDCVNSVAFSPDGTKVLTGARDATAKLWNVATGALIRTLTGHTAGVNSVAFSPDGTRVLTGSGDSSAKLWNTTGAVVPNVVGLAQRTADTAVTGAGLVCGTITQAYSAAIPEGAVISQAPAAGSTATLGSAVGLTVSKGPQPPVPNVVDLPQSDAVAAITGSGFTVGTITEAYSPTVWEGYVISQNPVAGTSAASGTAVALTVSRIPQSVLVPDSVGLIQSETDMLFYNAGLRSVPVEVYSSTVPPGIIISQDPVAGASVPLFSIVVLTVSKGPQPPVPDVVGLTQAAAIATITGVGLRAGTITQVYSSTVPSGSVISQSPAAGTFVALGTYVNLTVSKGPQPVTVPNVVGQTQTAAGTALTGANLIAGTITQQCSNAVAAGLVISQTPAADQQAAFGSAVALVVSTGLCDVTVPNVVGLAQAVADTALTGANLVTGTVTQECSNTVAAGLAISQTPAADQQVPFGSAVALVVSTGLCDVTVPNVVGLAQAAAGTVLTGANLVTGTVTQECSNTVAAGLAISQTPAADQQVPFGSAVALVVSTGLCNVAVPNVVGQTQTAAGTALTGANLVTGTVTQECSGTVAAGLVISQTPAAEGQVIFGGAVALVVSTGPCDVTVPNVVGLPQAEAGTVLLDANLTVGTVTQECSNTEAAGLVISQTPAADQQAAFGSAVALVVSSGLCNVTVPNVVGLPQAVADTVLLDANLTTGNVTQQCSNTVAAGLVISQTPAADAQVPFGSAVALVVSTGVCNVTVPNVAGQTQTAAGTALTGANLVTGTVTRECSDTVASGLVISQEPASGTLAPFGSAVVLTVSTGLCPVAVPDVVGQTQTAAESALTGASLTATVFHQCSNTLATGLVISQNPAAGQEVVPGSAVSLVVSTGPCSIIVPDVVGQMQTAADSVLTSASLTTGTVTQQCSNAVAAGRVVSQNPAVGQEVVPGSTVALVVSTGLCNETVPNVVGQTQTAAETAIVGARLATGTVTQQCSNTVAAGRVIGQNPVAGEQAPFGSAVALVVSTGLCNETIPSVVGQTQTAAETAIVGASLTSGAVTQQCSDTVAAGLVISQSPTAGQQAPFGSAVNLVVSTGVCPVTIPDVVGLTQMAATTAITGARLIVGNVTQQYSYTVAAGLVISQSPVAGSQRPPSSSVDLFISTGPPPNAPVVGSAASPTNNVRPTWTWNPGGGNGSGFYRYGYAEGNWLASDVAVTSFTPEAVLSEGSHTLYVQEHDPFGNWGHSGSYTVVVDTHAPNAPAVGGSETPTNSSRPTWTWATGGDGGAGQYRYGYSEGTWLAEGIAATSFTPVTALTEGSHTLYVQERDAALNWSNSGSYAVVVDLTAPIATLVSSSGAQVSQGIKVGVTLSEPSHDLTTAALQLVNASVEQFAYDNAAYTFTLKPTAEGDFSVRIPQGRFQDLAGNANAPSNVITRRYDITAPGAPAITTDGGSGPGQNFRTDAKAVLLEGTVATDAVRVLVNGSASGVTFSSGSAAWHYDGALTYGANPFAVTAEDQAGNRSTATGITVARLVCRDVYVSPKGNDASDTGSVAAPWRTIGRVMALTQRYSASDWFVTAHLAVGTYAERVVMEPHTALVGDSPSQRAYVRIAPVKAQLLGTDSAYALSAAQDTRLENLSLELPVDAPQGSEVLRIQHVKCLATNIDVNGRDVSGCVGVSILGADSSDTVVSKSMIERVDYGLRAVETRANITRNKFLNIRFDAVFVREPASKLADASSTPVLGNADQLDSTGANEFSNVTGFFVRNMNPETVMAQMNNWGLDAEAAIAVKMSGAVSFVPFVSGAPVDVPVPDVAGLTQTAADAALTDANLTTGAVTQQCSNTVAVGLVISQSPAAGQQVAFGSAVALVISTGACNVTVPDVVGQTQAAANTALTDANLITGTVSQQCSDTVAVGLVIGQSPAAGQQTTSGNAVDLVLSTGVCNVPMPDVVGMTQTAAATAITGVGLTVGTITEAYSATVASGLVISQTPAAAASVASGSTVALTVSKGSEPAPPTTADLLAKLQSSFAAIDTDGDGKVSYAEALTALPGLTQAVFDVVDDNGDGQIDPVGSRIEGGGCAGCAGNKGASSVNAVKEIVSNLFLGGLSLITLLASGKQRS